MTNNNKSSFPENPAFALDAKVAKAFARFAGGFWRGETRARAWLLTIGLVFSLLLSTAATVALNHWYRLFFDALEQRNIGAVGSAVLVFGLIIAAMAAIGVVIVFTRETLQVRWRAWLVGKLVERWLDRQRFYHLNVTGTEPPNPEYRISDDTRWATEIVVDLGIGLQSAVVGSVAFISILWSVGGAYNLEIGTVTLTIPAYMVIVALAYGLIASSMMMWIGRPLVGRVGIKNEAEGYFRFAMMRIRDNVESIALMGGANHERAILGRFYEKVVTRWLAIVRSHCNLTWITNASGPMIPIVPLLFAAPKYLSGELSLGQLTQIAAAFVQVQIAISWLVDNYNRFAEWYASARRVMDIVNACDAIDDRIGATPVLAAAGVHDLRVTGLELSDGGGRPLVRGVELELVPGEAVHIWGDSSVGKSTLVRALAGLLQPVRGGSKLAKGARVMITPQKAYLPLGTLRESLVYPNPRLQVNQTRLECVLADTGLGHLDQRLGEVARWDQVLSNGERQRLAIARLLLHMPDIVILDDALAALEEAAQTELLTVLRNELAHATILSFAQRPAPPGFYDRQLVLERRPGGALLTQIATRARVSADASEGSGAAAGMT
jgi:vitamin B12/bleomycin/antimicrobial peptide transport system ATP-binding/permease protein